jgi:hypothetical protein
MASRFDDDFISVEVLGSVAIARFSQHAAAYGHSARTISCLSARLFVMDPWQTCDVPGTACEAPGWTWLNAVCGVAGLGASSQVPVRRLR